MRRLIERGWHHDDATRQDLPGLHDLMDRLARRRDELRARYQLGDVLAEIRRELDEIVDQERSGVQRRLEQASSADPADPADADLRRVLGDLSGRRLDTLDALPSDVGERIRGLREYDFLEPEARRRFDKLVERLGKQVLDQFVTGMSDAINSVKPEDLAANREMVRDLNALMRERIGGASRTPTISWASTDGSFRARARSRMCWSNSPSACRRCAP